MNIVNLTDPIRQVSQVEAEKYFDNGEDVFLKIHEENFIHTAKWRDGEFVFKEDRFANMEFYVCADEDTLIVTRHDVIEQFFREKLKIKGKRLNYARPYEIEGKKVYGSLPLSMASIAETLTVVHGSVKDDEAIDRMTLEEFMNQIIIVKTYRAEAEEVKWE